MMKNNKREKGMTSGELSAFCSQVALLLDAGIPLYDGIGTIIGKGETGGIRGDMLSALSGRVIETGSLYQALKEDDRWPAYMAEMVGIGEQSGHLQDVMQSLSAYYEREGRIRETVTNAITYPIVLGAMLVVIVFVMLWKVLPVFERVLRSMGLSGESGMGLMHIGSVIGWVVLGAAVVILAAVLICLTLLKTKKRAAVLRILNRMNPALGRLQNSLSASRVAGVLSMMLSGGFPMEEALRMTTLVLEDPEAIRKVEGIRAGLEQGDTFADSVEKSGVFDELSARMIRVGAAAGREDTVMNKVASVYEEDVESRIAHLIGIIEPTLVVVLAVVVGAVLLAVMLPMTGVLRSMI